MQDFRLLQRLVLGLFLVAGVTGVALKPVPALAACSALPTNNVTATFTVSIPSTGAYRFWAHLYSPSSGNNAIYLQVDQTYCQITVGNASIPAGQFTWVDYQNGTTTNKITMNLSSGSHSVILAGLDPGVGVDKVMFLADTSCTPTGDGNNCVAASTPTPSPTPGPSQAPGPTPAPTVAVTPQPGNTPAPSGGTPVTGTITLPQPTDPQTDTTYYLDNQPVVGTQVDTAQLADGDHTLTIVETDKATGETSVKSQKLAVNNAKGWFAWLREWLKQPLNAIIAVTAGFAILGGLGAAMWRLRQLRQTRLYQNVSVPSETDWRGMGLSPSTFEETKK
jgi:hypothetical protein